ncbi:hypothetical protein ACOMCU_24795 [Lysinibacillus sp. UGB7]|uniref:phage major capsid protein n=1 Tax=Lysinibacillus sp. UGB7 TaxID=3411039 RepID=UPI003B7DE4D9
MNLQQMLARQQEIVDAAKAEGSRALSKEEQEEFDRLQTAVDALRALGDGLQAPSIPQGGADPNKDENKRQLIENERQRSAEITRICRNFDLTPDEFISSGKTIDQVRQIVLEKQLEGRSPVSTGVKIISDEGDKLRLAAIDGLAMRAGASITKPAEGAKQFQGMSLRDLAKETLRMEGIPNAYRLNDEDLLRQHLTPTSMFSGIIDQTARTVFEKAYTEAETTYQEWVKTGTLTDFRPTKTFQAGTAGELLLVSENGELKHDDPNAEEGPVRQLLTVGRQFTMSRQMFINDDVGFISQMPALYAQSARLGINRLVYRTLATNPAIWDGKQLFHEEHANIGKGSAPSVAALSEARRLLKKQKAAGGEVNLNIPARFMLVPTSLETAAAQLISTPVDPSATNPNVVNPFYNKFTIISDPELDDVNENGEKEWYVTADKLRSPIQVDFLNGIDMPTIVMKQAPAGQLGFVWDIYMDYGVSIVDYKTAIKNPGQL